MYIRQKYNLYTAYNFSHKKVAGACGHLGNLVVYHFWQN